MKLTERVKRKLQSFLEIQPACPQNVNIIESTDFTTDVFRSQIWYRGDTAELSQFFHQLCLSNGEINSMFWASVPTAKTVRRIHSGLPAIIADTLAYIVYSDMDDIDFGEKAKGKSEWEDITDISCGGMDFTQLVGQSVIDTLVDGDGAFKISVDSDTSQYPFVEFIGADMIEYEYHKGRITAIIFKTDYQVHSQKYTLCERYGIGRIESKLFDSNGNEVPLSICEQLAGINPVVEFAGNYMMAVPLKIYSSKKFKGRGKSLFDGGKSDCFDALDEVISQWWDAIRRGRVQRYIPSEFIPQDPETGQYLDYNEFGNDYIAVNIPLQEGIAQKIDVTQPEIEYEAFVSSYSNCLLMCLQGLVSPATLGIDVGKMSSADAQREKKDVTGNTRNTITAALEKVLPQLISATLKTYDNMQGKSPDDYEPIVSFGEYSAPDFGSRVETVGKASTYGVMSVATQVDELWGSSKDDEWKQEEVKRILHEKGIEQGDENAVADEVR